MPCTTRMRTRFSGPILGTPVGRRFRVLSWFIEGSGAEECLVIRDMRDVDGDTAYRAAGPIPEGSHAFDGTGAGPVIVVGQSKVEFFLEVEAGEADDVRSKQHSP